jgi:hypothetical protein
MTAEANIREVFERISEILTNTGYLLSEMEETLKVMSFLPINGIKAERNPATARTLFPAHVVKYFGPVGEASGLYVLGVGCLFADYEWRPIDPLFAACVFERQTKKQPPQTWWVKEAVFEMQTARLPSAGLPESVRCCPAKIRTSQEKDWFSQAAFWSVPLIGVNSPEAVEQETRRLLDLLRTFTERGA